MLKVEFDGELLAINQKTYNDRTYYVAQLFCNEAPDTIAIDEKYWGKVKRGTYHFVAEYKATPQAKFMKIVEVK